MNHKAARVSDDEREARLFQTTMHPVRLAIPDLWRAHKACVCHLKAVLHQRQACLLRVECNVFQRT
jgi:hypothetical protein